MKLKVVKTYAEHGGDIMPAGVFVEVSEDRGTELLNIAPQCFERVDEKPVKRGKSETEQE
jgi:hypothetical protein